MAKKEEKVVEEIQPTQEAKTETKKVDEPVLQEGGDMKMKTPKKPKQLGKQDNSVAKIDLSKAKEETKQTEENVSNKLYFLLRDENVLYSSDPRPGSYPEL